MNHIVVIELNHDAHLVPGTIWHWLVFLALLQPLKLFDRYQAHCRRSYLIIVVVDKGQNAVMEEKEEKYCTHPGSGLSCRNRKYSHETTQ